METHLKLFDKHLRYLNYIDSNDKLLPNVSYCEDNDEVHYNPLIDETRLIVKYNVTNASNPTQLYTCLQEGNLTVNGTAMFNKIELDGVRLSISDLDTAQGQYLLSEGEHIAKYTLKDPTLIGFDAFTMTVGAIFMQCTAIIEVNIPNTVTSIGSNPFASCTGLTSVTIPDSVTSIGDSVFGYCSLLTNITIPSGVTYIGKLAFFECVGLTNITIPNNVTSIGDNAFTGCSSLTNVTIGDSVTSIGEGAFSYCTSLTSITIPDSITSIDIQAFSNCSSLTSVIIQATTPPTLGEWGFDDNASGRKIYVPSESVAAYKAATNWSAYANDIQAIGLMA